ncbi:hypothetical protein ACGFZB_22560 [Streptomyces cinerochromogenes]|uniref:DUF3800 domain-containing protein n=1 Tax=Streptomyces cinerochromogenes TaxID=66422 RepID=A0ABW7B7P8_9ACTN
MDGEGAGGTRDPWTAAGRVLEVACDESGSDGQNLVGGNTEVFAHASVALPVEAALECVGEIRRRIRSPAEEYKAGHLLREKHRAVLVWLLAEGGPVHGRAHVHLTEKAFLVVDRVVGLLSADPADAVALYRHGPDVFGDAAWREFLVASNALLRVGPGGTEDATGEAFFTAVDRLVRSAPGSGAAGILRRLAAARSRAEDYRARMRTLPALFPVLNPLFPAVRHTAAHWSAGGRPVVLVHDRQNALTPGRIARIVQSARRDGIALEGLRLVDSRDDARVQIADFLAGAARKIASDELAGAGDPELTVRLRPYVGTESVWGDARSWARLAPTAENPGRSAEIDPGV